VLDVIDALMPILEPPGTDALLDNTGADPFTYMGGTLYGWVTGRSQSPVGTGEVQEDFEITFVYAAKDQGEAAGGIRKRDVTEELEAKANQYLTAIRTHAHADGAPAAWGNIQGRVDWDTIRALNVRGVAVVVTGNRIVTGQ